MCGVVTRNRFSSSVAAILHTRNYIYLFSKQGVMKSNELLVILLIVAVILLIVIVTAYIDVFFPTPSPVEFAKSMVNVTGGV